MYYLVQPYLSAIDRLMTVITVVHSCRLQTRLQAHQRFVSDAFLVSLDINYCCYWPVLWHCWMLIGEK